MKLRVRRRLLKLTAPLRAAHGVISERVLLAVSVTDSAGLSGHGEAAPLPSYDGVSPDRVEAALECYAGVLARCGDTDAGQLMDACRAAADVPVALAAIDLALWDRAGREQGRPVAELLSEHPARSLPVNASVWAQDPDEVAARVARAVASGFGCVKLKVGLSDDGARVAAARGAAGRDLALRLDANGAWSVEQAVAAIAALERYELELVEEPVRGLQAMRELRPRVATRVSIDETADEPGALGAGVADAVCLKISRCGGISSLLAAAALVRASGAEVYLASTLDGPIGIAGALHAAAALASRGRLAHCGLATLDLFEGLHNPLPARGGEIALPGAPGLGVDPL